ncbi:MAG: hypothetical protein M3433_01230 [Actinomycetota bacterium]|nr:hypothetical protein [Actinomycetota bacterium]
MANQDAKRLEQLAAEAQYRTQRLALYRARLYGGRAHDRARLAELQRGSDEAKARLRRARAAAAAPPPA